LIQKTSVNFLAIRNPPGCSYFVVLLRLRALADQAEPLLRYLLSKFPIPISTARTVLEEIP
jgi:hypothetical protein